MPEAIPFLRASTLEGVVEVLTESLRSWVLEPYFPRVVHDGDSIEIRVKNVNTVAADNVSFDEPALLSPGAPGTLIRAQPLAWRQARVLTNSEASFFRRFDELAQMGMNGPSIVAQRDRKITELAADCMRPVREGAHRLMAEALQGSVSFKVGGVITTASYGLEDLTGVSAAWTVAGTKITEDWYALARNFRRFAGVACDTVFFNPDLWSTSFAKNTDFKDYVKASPALSESYLGQGGRLLPNMAERPRAVSLFGVNWVPVTGTYVDRNGATQDRWPTTKLTLAALNAGDGYQVLEWGSVRDEYSPEGLPRIRTRYQDNPIAYTAEYADNGVPIIRVPQRVATVNLAP